MDGKVWIGCIRIPDVSAWGYQRSKKAEDPFVVIENDRVVGASRHPLRRGVELGMTKSRMKSLCENADILPRDYCLERTTWEELLESLNEFTPRLESSRPGLVWFEPRSGETLRSWLKQTRCHCGVAPNRSVAHLAALKAASGRLICIRKEYQSDFLSHTPVEALSRVGFPEEIAERLRLFGYEHIGDLDGLSKRHLEAQFGEEGNRLHSFLHPEPTRVSFYSPSPSVRVVHHFERDVSEPGPLRNALKEKASALQKRLADKACQRLLLRLRGREEVHKTTRLLREPTSDAGTIYRTASTLLRHTLTSAMEVRSLQLVARGLQNGSGSQVDLFRKSPALKRAIATVQKKHPEALFRIRTNQGAIFEEDRFIYERIDPESS